MDRENNVITNEFMEIGNSEKGRTELECAPPDSDSSAPPLERLPLNPYRSLGGFLNYAGWDECQRFLELDHAIRSRAMEDDHPESNDPEARRPMLRCSARLVAGSQCGNRFHATTEYVGSKCHEHRVEPTVTGMIRRPDELTPRRS